jgi:hypothetical protein
LLVEGLQAMVYKRIEAFPFCFAGSFSALLQFLILEKSSNNRAHAGGIYFSALFPGPTVEVLPVPDCPKICWEQIVQVTLMLAQPKLWVAASQAEPQPSHVGKSIVLGVSPAFTKFFQGFRVKPNVRTPLNILSQFGVIDDCFHFMGLSLQESR